MGSKQRRLNQQTLGLSLILVHYQLHLFCFFFFNFYYLFIWLCRVLVAACRIFSCGMQTLSFGM